VEPRHDLRRRHRSGGDRARRPRPAALGRPAAYLAKRFAAKEAFGKALGSGVRAPADWHGVWVSHQGLGQPRLEFSSAVAALLQAQGICRTHLSISDERRLASATVILECDA
jgi:holo-[acyl-carrier protein] synthase